MPYKRVSYIFSVALIEVKYQVFSYFGMLKVQINCSDLEISSRVVTLLLNQHNSNGLYSKEND